MLVWIIYDIEKNKIRNKVASQCKGYGLIRVQKSVFLGTLNNNEIDEISLKCQELMDKKKDSIYIFPMCDDDFKKVKLLGQAFDRKMVKDEVLAKFF
jgi:CRISPR-associated protein Cas2